MRWLDDHTAHPTTLPFLLDLWRNECRLDVELRFLRAYGILNFVSHTGVDLCACTTEEERALLHEHAERYIFEQFK